MKHVAVEVNKTCVMLALVGVMDLCGLHYSCFSAGWARLFNITSNYMTQRRDSSASELYNVRRGARPEPSRGYVALVSGLYSNL